MRRLRAWLSGRWVMVKANLLVWEEWCWQKFYRATRPRESLVEEFQRRFPGRCPICSYWRYGVLHGMTDTPAPPAHASCPEMKGSPS